MPVIIFFAAIYALAFLHDMLYKRFWDKNVFFNLTLSQNAVFEGDQITIIENASNKKRLPLPWISIQFYVPHHILYYDAIDRLSIGEEKYALFSFPANKTQSKRHNAVCSKRGFYVLKNFILSSSNILLTRTFSQELNQSYSVTVYPKLISIEDYSIPFKKISGHILAKRFINPDPFEFRSIREYLPFDSFRQINFKATAKTGDLMSNIYDYTVSQDITIFLNTQNYCNFNRNNVHEMAIRIAASYANYFIESGIPTGLVTTGADAVTNKPSCLNSGLSREHLIAIYEILARISLFSSEDSSDVLEDNLLPEYYNRDMTYIFISSKHDGFVYEKYKNLKQNGANILWILPMTSYDINNFLAIAPDDNIIVWEVENE